MVGLGFFLCETMVSVFQFLAPFDLTLLCLLYAKVLIYFLPEGEVWRYCNEGDV